MRLAHGRFLTVTYKRLYERLTGRDTKYKYVLSLKFLKSKVMLASNVDESSSRPPSAQVHHHILALISPQMPVHSLQDLDSD